MLVEGVFHFDYTTYTKRVTEHLLALAGCINNNLALGWTGWPSRLSRCVVLLPGLIQSLLVLPIHFSLTSLLVSLSAAAAEDHQIESIWDLRSCLLHLTTSSALYLGSFGTCLRRLFVSCAHTSYQLPVTSLDVLIITWLLVELVDRLVSLSVLACYHG